MKSFEGYLKQTAGDTYLLLAGGGIKPLSDFLTTNSLSNYNPTNNFKTINGNSIIGTGNISISGANGNYVQKTGDTMTGPLVINSNVVVSQAGLFGGNSGVYVGSTYNGNSSSGYDCIERAGAGNTLYLQYYHSGGVNMCHGGGEVRIEGGTFTVINDSCNTAFDALAYFRHYSNNDWGISIDKGGYDYGLRVWGAGGASNAIVTNGYVACYSTRSSSDRTMKHNIKSISKLFPIVEFNWKHNNKKSYGFIAQDVIKLGFQDMVYGEEGNMSLEYNAILSYYLAQLSNITYDKHQEIDSRINLLEKRILDLELENQDLKNKLEKGDLL